MVPLSGVRGGLRSRGSGRWRAGSPSSRPTAPAVSADQPGPGDSSPRRAAGRRTAATWGRCAAPRRGCSAICWTPRRTRSTVEGIRRGTNGALLRLDLPRLDGEVHDRLEDLGPGDPVDRGVVDLRVERAPAALDAGDDVGLPQRPGPVERPRVDPGDLLAELRARSRAPAARARAGGTRGRSAGRPPSRDDRAPAAPPPGAAGAARRGAAGARRRRGRTRGPTLPPGAVRRVEEDQAADVTHRGGCLDVQELRVERRQLAHACRSSSTRATALTWRDARPLSVSNTCTCCGSVVT